MTRARRLHRFGRWIFIGVLLGCATGASLAEPPGLSQSDRQFVERLTRDYLRNNPQVLKEALAALGRKQTDDRRRSALSVLSGELAGAPASSAIGSKQPDLTIVEFLDYRCPYCRKVERSIQTLLQSDARLRVVHKQLPILGRASVLAARIDLVAQKLGRHAEFHAALMSKTGEIDERAVIEAAQSINLDFVQLKALIDSPEITAALRADLDLAKKLALTTTPAFVVGDEVIHGAPEMSDLAQLIAQERALRR